MKNRKLAKAIEEYVISLRNHMVNPTGENFKRFQKAEMELTPILAIESEFVDITEMFSDLHDYWDTLEAGK
jgi:hypothetical protein